ncbi:BRCA1 BRCA2-containing complex, subunit 3 [Terramyces sp. JEL0728]|nr:BRCA1 BRCA2-containing complex, subunit 3 [Terramyces sp. JEL0728]
MKVTVDASVHLLLSTFALSNEMEEVAAMLLGSAEEDISITSCVFLVRKDKRKDRVEISSEQLSEAMERAEKLGLRLKLSHVQIPVVVQPSELNYETIKLLQEIPLVYLKEENDDQTAISFQTSALRVLKLEQTLILPLIDILKTRLSCS